MTRRETILKELKRRGWSRYRLVKELDGAIPMSTIYNYLRGEKDSETDLGSDRVSIILEVLGMTITTKADRRKGAKKKRRL